MKLLYRAILYYSLAMFLSFAFAGAILYNSIRYFVLKEVSDALLTEKQIIQRQLERTDSVPDFSDIFKHQIEVVIYDHRVVDSQIFIDTLLNDAYTNRRVEYRFLVFTSNTPRNRGYMITTSRSIQEEKRLLNEIFGIIIILFAFLSLLQIAILFSLSRKLWGPFYRLLSDIEKYDVKTNNEFIPGETRITEFAQLNMVLKKMTEKMNLDYNNLKEFSENASHEIQTPLAIIRTRIEQILQYPGLNVELAKHLALIEQSVNKISRINQALTLISKIENNQFSDIISVNINRKLSDLIVQYNEFIEEKRLKVSLDAPETVELKMNSELADLLLSNLIKNAIKHNVDGGWINIKLHRKELIMQNSGKDPHIDTSQLFMRFKKAGHTPDSSGLGLAIVKKVTDLYGMDLTYKYSDLVHTLRLAF